MLIGGVSTSYTLLLGMVLVLVMSCVDLLIGSLITFFCFFFLLILGTICSEYSSSEVGCSTPSGVGISSPSEIRVKVYAFVLLY